MPPPQYIHPCQALVRVAVIKFLEKRTDAQSGKSGVTPRGTDAPSGKSGVTPRSSVGTDDRDGGDASATAVDPKEEVDCIDLAEACRRSLDDFILLNVPPEALVSDGDTDG